MKRLLFLLAITLSFMSFTTSVEYAPDVTLTNLGSNQYEVKVEMLLPAGQTGSIVTNTLNGITRSIEVNIVDGVPINGQHLETYTATITRGASEAEVEVDVYLLEQGKPKKKKGQAVAVYSQ